MGETTRNPNRMDTSTKYLGTTMIRGNVHRAARGVAALAAALPALAQTYSGQYAVILRDAPVAQRFVGRESLRTTAAEGHRRQIGVAQEALRRQMAARN